MTGIPREIDALDEAMAAVLRLKTPAERLAIAHGLWSSTRAMLLSVLRDQPRDWPRERVEREAARRMSHGPG